MILAALRSVSGAVDTLGIVVFRVLVLRVLFLGGGLYCGLQTVTAKLENDSTHIYRRYRKLMGSHVWRVDYYHRRAAPMTKSARNLLWYLLSFRHSATQQLSVFGSCFYRAMLCIRGTSHGPVSVCLSVTSRNSTKTAKRRITQTTPHDTPGTLVY